MGNNQIDEKQANITKVYKPTRKYLKLRKIVYYIMGILQTFLVFRLIFKLLGANPSSSFVSFIYKVSGILLAPFSGIFRTSVTQGIETKSVLEPANIIAMITYAIVAYAVVMLIKIYAIPRDDEIE